MKLKLLSLTIITLITIGFYGCTAKKLYKEAKLVELVNEKPNMNNCRFIQEITGSQGNWITGDFTSNQDLVIGARNELRNKAFELGGNIVYIQDMKNTNSYHGSGTTNTTAVGKVYKCRN